MMRHEPSEETLTIAHRARPVGGFWGLAGYAATHTFLVLLDSRGEVIDSLSFDPSNSVGSKDAAPENSTRGERAIISGNAEAMRGKWGTLRSRYEEFAKTPYRLGTHNCTHAAEYALNGINKEGLPALAENAAKNSWWDWGWGRETPENVTKKQI